MKNYLNVLKKSLESDEFSWYDYNEPFFGTLKKAIVEACRNDTYFNTYMVVFDDGTCEYLGLHSKNTTFSFNTDMKYVIIEIESWNEEILCLDPNGDDAEDEHDLYLWYVDVNEKMLKDKILNEIYGEVEN